ncbi:MAG: oxygenase MpaB family protein [Stenotrophobium sp.]
MGASIAESVIPSRHGADLKEGRRMAKSVGLLIRGDAEPTPARWQALGEALNHGDAVADRLVDWMYSAGMQAAHPVFERALNHGIASVPDAPAPLREFFEVCEQRPAWLDEKLLQQGAEVFQQAGMSAYYVLRDLALMGGYQAAGFNRTLILTGALKGRASRRVAETMKWTNDVTAVGGMARYADGFKSTVRVRLVHAMIRRRVRGMPEWDAAAWGLPVNQADMAATYLGFSVVLLIGLRVMGMPVTREEGRAVMHLWCYACWLMGVDERWLRHDEQGGRKLLFQLLLTQLPPDESSRQLGHALMNETLQLPYPHLRALRVRFERARHLSVTRLFVGTRGMQALGLPRWTLPWYPLVSLPFTFVWHTLHKLLPGGRARMIRLGRQAQLDILQLHFGMLAPEVVALHAV